MAQACSLLVTTFDRYSEFELLVLKIHTDESSRMLMDTIITIEYGDELQNTCGVHEGIMCCNSRQVQSWCAQAKSLRGKYDKCEEVAQKLISISILAITKAKFEENEVNTQVSNPFTIHAISIVCSLSYAPPDLDHPWQIPDVS